MRQHRFLRAMLALGIILALVLSILVIALPPAKHAHAQLADTPWPMFRHDLQHTGTSPYNGPEVPALRWSFVTEGSVTSSPAIGADGTIYVASEDDNLYAIRPGGSLRWSFTMTPSTITGWQSSPAIGADGTIYVGSSENGLYAVNPDGSLKWTFTTQWIVFSSPVVGSDGTIYVSSANKLYAINPNGSLKWSFTIGGGAMSSPAIGTDGTIYVGSFDDKKLYAVNPDGSQKWSFTTGWFVRSSPAIGAGGTIYVGSQDGNLYAVNPDGTEQWRFEGAGGYSSPAIGADGTIYANSDKLYAINTDGTKQWSFAGAGGTSSPAIGADGTIYVGSEDNNVYAVNPDGTEKWRFTTGDRVISSPTIGDDGTIYVGSNDNKLYAIGEATAVDIDVSPVSLKEFLVAEQTSTQTLTISNMGAGDLTWNLSEEPGVDWLSATPASGTVAPLESQTADVTFSSIGLALGTYTTSLEIDNNDPDEPQVQVSVTLHVIEGGLVNSPWPMFRHDLEHTGRSPFSGPEIPEQKWSFTEGWIGSSPAIGADGTIYVGSADAANKLYALNPDGTEKWSFTTGGQIRSSPAIGADGTIYVGSDDNKLYAINPDGTEKWNFTTGAYVRSSPAIGADGTIYVGSFEDKLYAIYPDGTLKWTFYTWGDVFSSPAMGADGTIYVGCSSPGAFYAINPDSSLKWRFATTGHDDVWSSPAVGADGTIYVGSYDNKLYAINPDGTENWSFSTAGYVYSSPAIGANGTIYVGSFDNKLYAINPDGTERWSFSTDGVVLSSPAVGADGTIYVGSDDNKLHAINPDGTERWNFTTEGFVRSSPAIGADGTIYVGSDKLYAISEPLPPQADFSTSPTSGEAPLSVQFTDQSTGNITSWQWDFNNDGAVDSTEQHPAHAYTDIGTYTVSLTVSGPGGSDTETKVDYIQVTVLQALLDQIQAEVSELRGLGFLEEVDCQFITREELQEWVIEDLEEDIEEINTTQELFVLLDLMEEGQNLYTILVDLYSEQIIGFYNYILDELYVVSDIEALGPMEEVTFAHEYTHALQDQHFDLGSLPWPDDNSDFSMALDPLIEGDATFVEIIYILDVLDESEREALFAEPEEPEDGAFEAAPRVIQENLLFPYVSGLDFVLALWEEGGYGWDLINQAYSDPPQSTEQILHPEKYYLDRDEPQSVTIPDLESALGAGWSQLDTDVLGELNIRIYLETFLGIGSDQAINAAEGWDGDRYLFLTDAEGRKLLVLSSVWDSESDAHEFFNAYITFVEEKSGGAWTLCLDDAGMRWGKTEEASIYLGQQGSEVLIVIAPDEAVTGVVLTEFPEFYTAPQADFSASLTQAIVRQTIEFSDSSTGDVTSWAWDFDSDDTVDSTEQNPSYSYAEPGTYTVSLTVSNPATSDTETKTGYVSVYTALQADFSASLTQGVVGQAIEFSDSSTGDVTSWSWDFDNDGTVDSAEQNPSHAYANPGTYTVSLSVSNPAASDTETKTGYILVIEALATQTVIPDTACTVETLDKRICIEFPKGSVTDETQVYIKECPVSDVPSAPSGFKLGNTYFSIEEVNTLAKEVTITVKYSDEDVAAAGGDAQRLALAYYHENAPEWKVLDTKLSTAEKTLSASTDQLSTWAVLAEEALPAEEPAPEEENLLFGLPIWIWAAIGAAVVLIAAIIIGIVIGRGLARK